MDWMSDAAGEAGAHLAPALKPRFGPRSWDEFSSRLTDQGGRLFRLLHRLYGWRYDFAWIYEQVVEVAAQGFLARSKLLRRIDRGSTDPPLWLSDPASLIGMAYLDRYAGTVKGVRDKSDHLTSLGVTLLHLLPTYAIPDGDVAGGFAVSDYRRLREGIGTSRQLAKIAKELREVGITLVLDLVLSDTASDHPWAKAARKGDPRYLPFYFTFRDRETADRHVGLRRSMTRVREGDAFTWQPDMDGGAWVGTTFGRSRWDLNYSNPDVLAAMAGEMLYLANLGAGVIRLNGAEFLLEDPGTDCENLPEAHAIMGILDAVARIAAPSVSFLSGSMVPSDRAASFVAAGHCRAAYNSLLMSSTWEALAVGDTRLLARALGDRFRLPEGCMWITYLRSHDDFGWWFANEDARALGIDPESHRRYLDGYYTGEREGSTARGQLAVDDPTDNSVNTISGTTATLAGVEAAVENADGPATDLAVKRMLAGFALIVGAGGVPMLFLGDEIAQLSDHTYQADPALAGDNRWSHRPFFDWPRLESATAGQGPQGAVLAGLRRLLDLRRDREGFGPGIPPVPIDLNDRGLIGFHRGPVLVVVNMTERPVIVSRSSLPAGDLFDLVSEDAWDGHVLGPYEYRFVLVRRAPEAIVSSLPT